jgi:hypothetical protein
MKTTRIIFGVLTLMVILAIVIYKPFAPASEKVVADGEYCFARVQEVTEAEPYMVEEYIDLVLSGATVTGTQSGVQSGPDMTNGYQGDLLGTRTGNDLKLVFDYEIEGSRGQELELFSLVGNDLHKHRYELKDENGVLVPDMESTPKTLIYTPEACG